MYAKVTPEAVVFGSNVIHFNGLTRMYTFNFCFLILVSTRARRIPAVTYIYRYNIGIRYVAMGRADGSGVQQNKRTNYDDR